MNESDRTDIEISAYVEYLVSVEYGASGHCDLKIVKIDRDAEGNLVIIAAEQEKESEITKGL